jgi:hypothetical protein
VSGGELPLPELDTQRLAALVFELASQLQAERAHRLALEAALAAAGVLPAGAAARLAEDPALRAETRQAADDSVRRLLRVLAEQDDARRPLRTPPKGGT